MGCGCTSTSMGALEVFPPNMEEGSGALPSPTCTMVVWDPAGDPTSTHMLSVIHGRE